MAAVSAPSLQDLGLACGGDVASANIALSRVALLHNVVCELLAVIEDVLGRDDAESYANMVAPPVADWIDTTYHRALGPDDFSVERLADVFADLTVRFGASHTVGRVTGDAIVVHSVAGLFGRFAAPCDAVTALASAVFARIAAENTGYARVEYLSAPGEPEGASIVLHFNETAAPTPSEHEYYRVGHTTFA